MLTPSDKLKIENFARLNKNHQRVFRHRLMKKCINSIPDIEFVLLNHKKLSLKIEKAINTSYLSSLLETYENLVKLQKT
jgi:hypothetical protein